MPRAAAYYYYFCFFFTQECGQEKRAGGRNKVEWSTLDGLDIDEIKEQASAAKVLGDIAPVGTTSKSRYRSV
jgi:hypothetical protein